MADALSSEFFDLQEAVAGRYSIDRELGRGGMGIVFLARDVTLDRPVAIKLFPPSLAQNPSHRGRFLREARTAAKLSHPHIVPIHAVEEHEDLVFFAMTYVDGETLTQRIGASGPLAVRDAVRVIREVAWALVHAHSSGVVHRDIKADNIMLERGTNRALVTDFGIAQLEGVSPDTDEFQLMGTPEFMSPEQATGETVDERSDVYSLGVVAYLALTGRLPFEGATPSEILAHHIRTPAPHVATIAPGVPSKLAALVDRCLVKKPEDRVQTASTLADALGAALEVRAELPVAVRLFLEETKRDEARSTGLVSAVVILMFAPGFLLSGIPLMQLMGLGVVGLAAGGPLAVIARRARRVLASGYDREDVVQAFVHDLGSRHEELAFLYGPQYAERAARMRKISYYALGAAGVSIVGAITIPAAAGGFLLGALAGTLGGTIAGLPAERRSDRKAKRRLKFWRSRFGRWLFRVAGLGLTAQPRSAALTNRPTELAVGMAVSSLFDALPKEARSGLGDLPDVVAGLESDAQTMRKRVEEFDKLLAEQEGDMRDDPAYADADTVEGQRYRAVRRIQEARDDARRRLKETVAALEALRVDLLRMHAGHANLESVTTNLGNARELAADIDRLIEGRKEIEDFLRG